MKVRIGLAGAALVASAVLVAACSGKSSSDTKVRWTFTGIGNGAVPAAGAVVEVFLLSNTASAVTTSTTDSTGVAKVDVSGVTAPWYAKISGTDVHTTYLHFPEARLTDPGATDGAALTFVPEAIWGLYHAAAGESPNPARAVVGAFAANLGTTLVGVPGLRIAVTGSGHVVYVGTGGLDPSATSTDSSGQAAIFRVLPGPVVVTASGGGLNHSRTIPTWADAANNVVLQMNAP